MANKVLRQVGKYKISADDVATHLRLNLGLESLIRTVAVEQLVRDYCAQAKIVVSDAELQTAADAWRSRHGLFKSKDTMTFFETLGIDPDDFETHVETGLLVSKLQEHLFAKKVRGYFVEHQNDFDEVELRHLVVKDKGVAEEIKLQIVDDRVPFASLAKKHSLDKMTQRSGGYLGWVRRGSNVPEVEADVFTAKPPTLLGPYKVPAGYELIEVLDQQPAEFTDAVRAEIMARLFEAEFIVKHLPIPTFD